MRGRTIVVIGIYASNDDASTATNDHFENALKEMLNRLHNGEEVILAGDLNARVDSQVNSAVVGIHGESTINNNGERLIYRCTHCDLKITNSYFAHKEIHKYTWHQNARGLKSIIDYIIVKKKNGIKVQD